MTTEQLTAIERIDTEIAATEATRANIGRESSRIRRELQTIAVATSPEALAKIDIADPDKVEAWHVETARLNVRREALAQALRTLHERSEAARVKLETLRDQRDDTINAATAKIRFAKQSREWLTGEAVKQRTEIVQSLAVLDRNVEAAGINADEAEATAARLVPAATLAGIREYLNIPFEGRSVPIGHDWKAESATA